MPHITAPRPVRSSHSRRLLVGLLVLIIIVTALAASRALLLPERTEGLGTTERIRVTTQYGGGRLPDGADVFDDQLPGVAKLDPALRDALRRATLDAGRDGVAVLITSGWRSPQYQQRLLDEAIATYGSRDEAARWVATPEASSHVSGRAVDLGPVDATSWLSQHGAGYGLCQTYANESWHYELRPSAPTEGCPAMYDDPTADPRMER